MTKILVLQADNRLTLNYVILSKKVNMKMSNYLNYEYIFINFDQKYRRKYKCSNYKYAKLFLVKEYLENNEYDIIIFLDSDAWIQNAKGLDILITKLINNESKHGCYSRDPYNKKNTFINSGSFIIKVNDYTRQMYNKIIYNFHTVKNTHWTNDQFYISNYIYENKDHFFIFVPELLNTPDGLILRHNWHKSQKIFLDMERILKEPIITDFICYELNDYYDNKEYPNPIEL
jgi:hypothetical protein